MYSALVVDSDIQPDLSTVYHRQEDYQESVGLQIEAERQLHYKVLISSPCSQDFNPKRKNRLFRDFSRAVARHCNLPGVCIMELNKTLIKSIQCLLFLRI